MIFFLVLFFKCGVFKFLLLKDVIRGEKGNNIIIEKELELNLIIIKKIY